MSRAKQREKRRNKDREIREGIREEKIDLIDYCGIKDQTPYLAVKNIIRKERAAAHKSLTVPTAATAATA